MKKIILILTIIVSILMYNINKEDTITIPDTAIRLRVIPNSNSSLDQNMKQKVKTYLEKNTYLLLKNETNIEDARDKIKRNIPIMEEDIAQIFKDNNYQMNYNINYGYNHFPKKEYRGIKYKEGYYESIVINIGKAKGDNWWCVLFPNLCLADLEKTSNIEYQSWVLETIKKYFNNISIHLNR